MSMWDDYEDVEDEDERQAAMSETHSVVPINGARYRFSRWVVDKMKDKHKLKPEDVCAVLAHGDFETGSKSGSTIAKGKIGRRLIRVVISSMVTDAYKDIADYEVITAFGPND